MLSFGEYQESADYILKKCKIQPEIAVFLGSGLGGVVDMVENPVRLPYAEIPHFPIPTNTAHKGEMWIGSIAGRGVALLSGRYHFYEGFSLEETVIPVKALYLAGVKKLILTNSAGGVNTSFRVGDIMLIRDHIKFVQDSPERGETEEQFGCRFFSMNSAYSPKLNRLAKEIAEKKGITLREGVYFYMPGPQYETPAEIRAIRILGGDAVGMSTVAEAITAARLGMEVMAFSCISNLAAGMSDIAPSDEEVVENGALFTERMQRILEEVFKNI